MAKNTDSQKIKITRPCKVLGEVRAVDDVIPVDPQTAANIVAMGKATYVAEAPKKGEKLTTKSAQALTRKG